jgi:uncharacterized protein DUF4124
MTGTTTLRTPLTLLAILAMLVAVPADAGRLYKWVDEDGNVHYGSQIPPEYAGQESQVLNEQAVTLETRERERTDEELDAAAVQRREDAEQQRVEDAQARADRVLLDSYASVADMETARDSRIAALEAQVSVTAGRIGGIQSRVIELEEQIGLATARDREPDPEVVAELEATRGQLLTNQRFLQARRDEQDRIRAQFAEDIEHYLELKAAGGDDDSGSLRR